MPQQLLQCWVCILPVNQMGQNWNFLPGLFPATMGFVSHREKPTQRAQTHESVGDGMTGDLLSFGWQRNTSLLTQRAPLTQTWFGWERTQVSIQLFSPPSPCESKQVESWRTPPSIPNHFSVALKTLVHLNLTPHPHLQQQQHPRLMPVSALHPPRAKIQEIKQHKKTLESGSLGSDVLVVGSSQKMPRQSIFGEDYGLTPTLPLHRFLSDCSGPKELYIKWFWLKCYYRACGKKISTAHLESPSCDQ